MARARNIKPGFFINDELAQKNDPLGRLFFIGLWTIADFKGDIEWRAGRIKAQILPYDDCDIKKIAINLDNSGFIRFYSDGEKIFLNIVNFRKHQNPHKNEKEAGSDIPAFCENMREAVDIATLSINRDLSRLKPDQDGTNRADSLIPHPSSPIHTTTTLPHTRPETVDNSVDNYPQPKPPRFYLKSDWVIEKTDQRVVSAARLINIAVADISDHAFNQALLAFRGMSAQREFNDELAAINVFCAKYLRSALLKPSKTPIEQPTRELTREERRAIQDKKYENDEANFNRGRWDKKNNKGDQNV